MPETVSLHTSKLCVNYSKRTLHYNYCMYFHSQEKEKAEKKKASAAAVPGRGRTPSTGEEDEYVIEQVLCEVLSQTKVRKLGNSYKTNQLTKK